VRFRQKGLEGGTPVEIIQVVGLIAVSQQKILAVVAGIRRGIDPSQGGDVVGPGNVEQWLGIKAGLSIGRAAFSDKEGQPFGTQCSEPGGHGLRMGQPLFIDMNIKNDVATTEQQLWAHPLEDGLILPPRGPGKGDDAIPARRAQIVHHVRRGRKPEGIVSRTFQTGIRLVPKLNPDIGLALELPGPRLHPLFIPCVIFHFDGVAPQNPVVLSFPSQLNGQNIVTMPRWQLRVARSWSECKVHLCASS